MRSIYRASLLATASTVTIIPLASCLLAACFNNSSSGPGDGGALPDVLAPDVNLPGAGKARYLVGGSVDYLWGSGLTLVGDNIEPLTIAPMNGAPSLKFFFKTAVPEGFPYKVTIDQQPTNPAQTCTISGASGKVGFGDVTGITVNCAPDYYAVGVSATGVAGGALVLQDAIQPSGAVDSLTIMGDGNFSFPMVVAAGGSYDVSVASSPLCESCTIAGASSTGVLSVSGPIPTVPVTCSPTLFNVGGTVTGLTTGQSIALSNSGGSPITVDANGVFDFPLQVPNGGAYDAELVPPSVDTCPVQTCTLSGNNSTVQCADVTSISVACTTNTYTVSAQVSGLQGSLSNTNGSIQVSSDGVYAFPAQDAGSTYNVQVAPTDPSDNACTISGVASGPLCGNVMLTVSCQPTAFTLGGQVSGLPIGATVTLASPVEPALQVSANGTFAFVNPIAIGGTYDVTVATQPANAVCTPTAATNSGSVGEANVSTVQVNCVSSFPVTVNITNQCSPATAVTVSDSVNNVSVDSPSTASSVVALETLFASNTYDITVDCNDGCGSDFSLTFASGGAPAGGNQTVTGPVTIDAIGCCEVCGS